MESAKLTILTSTSARFGDQEALLVGSSNTTPILTVIHAIPTVQGITPYFDLVAVQATRNQALSAGGGHRRHQLFKRYVVLRHHLLKALRAFSAASLYSSTSSAA